MKKKVIVSLADSSYFELLNELIDSIKNFKESSDVAICLLDAGLKEEQKKLVEKAQNRANGDVLKSGQNRQNRKKSGPSP